MKNSKKTDRHKTRPSDNISTEQTYTLEELKEAYNNPKPMAVEVPYEGVPKNIQEAMKSGEGFVHKKEN